MDNGILPSVESDNRRNFSGFVMDSPPRSEGLKEQEFERFERLRRAVDDGVTEAIGKDSSSKSARSSARACASSKTDKGARGQPLGWLEGTFGT
jgi:hypothetical protein